MRFARCESHGQAAHEIDPTEPQMLCHDARIGPDQLRERRARSVQVASRQVRGRQPVVPALPRPSVNVGASIERVFGQSTVRTKPGLKGRKSLAETCIVTSSTCLVTSSRHRK
jgi:hypothetical protein